MTTKIKVANYTSLLSMFCVTSGKYNTAQHLYPDASIK